MRLAVGFQALSEGSWFAHSPSLGSWIALIALVAMNFAYMLVRRGATTPQTTRHPRIAQHAPRVWVVVALLGPGVAVVSNAPPRAVIWWFVAGPAFSTVLLFSVFLLVLIIAHPRETLIGPAQERVGAWIVSGVLLAASLCLPLVFLALSTGAEWDATTSLACAMCAAYALAVIAALLVHRWRDDHDTVFGSP